MALSARPPSPEARTVPSPITLSTALASRPTRHTLSTALASHEDWEFFIEQFDLDGAERQLLRAVQRQTALRWATRECIDPGTLRSLPDAERLDILLDRVRFVCTSAF